MAAPAPGKVRRAQFRRRGEGGLGDDEGGAASDAGDSGREANGGAAPPPAAPKPRAPKPVAAASRLSFADDEGVRAVGVGRALVAQAGLLTAGAAPSAVDWRPWAAGGGGARDSAEKVGRQPTGPGDGQAAHPSVRATRASHGREPRGCSCRLARRCRRRRARAAGRTSWRRRRRRPRSSRPTPARTWPPSRRRRRGRRHRHRRRPPPLLPRPTRRTWPPSLAASTPAPVGGLRGGLERVTDGAYDRPASPARSSTGGNIPDPMTVLAAKKKRQMLRETAAARAGSDSDDYIPLSGGRARRA